MLQHHRKCPHFSISRTRTAEKQAVQEDQGVLATWGQQLLSARAAADPVAAGTEQQQQQQRQEQQQQ